MKTTITRTKAVAKINVQEKAIDFGEKELFGLYYDYDSAFEHGLLGPLGKAHF